MTSRTATIGLRTSRPPTTDQIVHRWRELAALVNQIGAAHLDSTTTTTPYGDDYHTTITVEYLPRAPRP